MAQLSDDCFAFGGALLPVDDAIARINAAIPTVAGIEPVPLAQADNRILAADLTAPIPLPPFDNTAVDGYAVRLDDLIDDAPTPLLIEGRTAAGDTQAAPLRAGHARRVLTGAILPPGAGVVFMQEDVTLDGARVIVPPGLRAGANLRRAGEDIAAGSRALPAGRRLRPQDVALAAALGQTTLAVRTPLSVGLFSTGNEVVAPGASLGPGRIYDANQALLAALLRRTGASVADLGVLRDEPALVRAAIERHARTHDLLLATGGVSAGEEDHVGAAIAAQGRLVFWRLAIKPGRPVALGVIAGTPFIGLPGNPVAAFVTFVRLVRPLLARLSGEVWSAPTPLPVRTAFAWRKKTGRREYLRARLTPAADGIPLAHRHPQDGAGVITSLTDTDGLIELPEPTTQIAAGEIVGFLPYPALI